MRSPILKFALFVLGLSMAQANWADSSDHPDFLDTWSVPFFTSEVS